MFQIDNDTSVPAEPARPAAGDLQWFSGGNPGAGQPATVLPDWWLNMVQNEMAHVVTQAGLALDKGDDTQLYQAMLAIAAAASAAGHGQAYLDKVGNDLVLTPFGGNRLVAGGQARVIPDGGVALAPGLAADTTYNIYAFWNAGIPALQLEASATGHQLAAGIRVKTGDATRSLVGKARTDGGGNWQSGALTISYFNRRRKTGFKIGGGFSTGSTVFVEISAALRQGFVTWGDVRVVSSAAVRNSTLVHDVTTSIGIDSALAANGASISQQQNADDLVGQAAHLCAPQAEGYHYATPLFAASGGTGFSNNVNIQVEVMG